MSAAAARRQVVSGVRLRRLLCTSSRPPLFAGVLSTEWTDDVEWKRDVGSFRVVRHMEPSGELVDGVAPPFDSSVAQKIYRTMVRSSVYDEMLLQMQRQGRIAFYCANFGEEATSTASAAALEPQDMVWPHYRELGMFLWRGLTAQQIVDQNMGNEGDGSKGRNLQVHYCLPDDNVQTVHAVLGTHIPQAPGAGYAYRLDKEDRVSVAYFGDGAASEGDALVALNFAAVFRSQTLFICRNNGYSISTPVEEQYGGDGIAARGAAFGIPSIRVDGNDVAAVYAATREARALSVREGTPVVLELMTYRVGDHTTSDDSSAYRKEDRAEVDALVDSGPIARMRRHLEASAEGWSAEEESAAHAEARAEMVAAIAAGEGKKRPPVAELFNDVYASPPWHLQRQRAELEEHLAHELAVGEYATELYAGFDASGALESTGVSDAERIASEAAVGSFVKEAGGVLAPGASSPVATERLTMVAAINDALKSALRSEPRAVVLGEDVGFGGVFRATAGLRNEFGPGRVMNTPVSEQGIAAFAVGLSVTGYKAIAEIQFADYIFPAFDQIVNEIAKYRSRTAGRGGHCGNIVLRAPCGAVGHGSMYHSQSVEAYFAHCPGLTIVVPRGPKQAKGLLLAAINAPDPVLFFEPKALYRAAFDGDEGAVPVGDYTLPIGVADVVRTGEDITLIGWGNQVGRLEEAAERAREADGVHCEVIDLQTIVPWDVETVVASVRKTGRCIISHEAPSTNGFGAELAAAIQQECFLHLEAPVTRVCGLDTHFPYAWEEFYLPSPSRVHRAIRDVVDF